MGKNQKQKFEQEKISLKKLCKVKPQEKKKKKKIHAWQSTPLLCTSIKKSSKRSKADYNLRSGPILAVLIYFLYVIYLRFALECYLERETKIESDLSQVELITAENIYFLWKIFRKALLPFVTLVLASKTESIK